MIFVCDTECYANYWLLKLYNPANSRFLTFELSEWRKFDVWMVRQIFENWSNEFYGFNSRNYDDVMIAGVLAGYDNARLLQLSNAIIQNGLKPWDIEREWGLQKLNANSIDLIEVLPGKYSLKAYGAKNHTRLLQDLPIEPGVTLTYIEAQTIDKYCENDCVVLDELRVRFEPEISLRAAMSKEFDIDLRSKSDAQIAEALFKKQLPFKVRPPEYSMYAEFRYIAPQYLRFVRPDLQQLLRDIIASYGEFDAKVNVVFPAIEGRKTTIGNTTYQLGIGGMHSTESRITHRADSTHSLFDFDVASYYPKIIETLRLCPVHIGDAFLHIYCGWIADRLLAKRAGDKRKASASKTKVNGTFGKTNSPYSILYSPEMMLAVTITGQLTLLMLIERLEAAGISVVSANTDGVVIKCPRTMHNARDALIAEWERETQFETENVEYLALCSRDVNSYIAFTAKGDVKLKGAYAPPEPVGPSWPNPGRQICVDAVIEHLKFGVDIEQTIRRCTDIKRFVSVQNVRGGAIWARGDVYLGKVVRWYYATGETAPIRYKSNGNKVPLTDGCRPCMTLPETLPDDIDYAWYVREAREILNEVNYRGV